MSYKALGTAFAVGSHLVCDRILCRLNINHALVGYVLNKSLLNIILNSRILTPVVTLGQSEQEKLQFFVLREP